MEEHAADTALAAELFDQFCVATTLKNILACYRGMCDALRLRPAPFPQFYPRLRASLRSWKAQALWKKLDARAAHKCYSRGRACAGTRVLVIGAGPCGLRAAIEAQLLGAKVVVIEKRDRITRNNVLHLWPFVIHDLRALGAKKFFGKFCAGAIDHISIRQLQCILLKVTLLLGVELHEGIGFERLVPPSPANQADKHGWRAEVVPADHPVAQYEFDVLIGADGKRNTLEGFRRKEFRGKLAIAITANFINKHSEAEARVEEISGVAFIFNQKFFKELYAETGIDLENIVYYKDDTHYFVMTAKKHSLLEKGVILQDMPDTARLLGGDNVDREALMRYAREAADFSTDYQMPDLEFAVNHYGQPDVAMFDFTSMYAAESASRVIERRGYRLLTSLVGDSLLEPFWPTGSGCARGFLSCLDAAWAIRAWGQGTPPLSVVAERESVYRLLAQTTPENLQRDYASYTLEPASRYPNLNRCAVLPAQVRSLIDTDDPTTVLDVSPPEVSTTPSGVRRRRRDSHVHPDTLLHWLQRQTALYGDELRVDDLTESLRDGRVLCAVLHRYRPDLVDWASVKPGRVRNNNQLAFDVLERELGIPPIMTGAEMERTKVPDKLTMLTYLSQIYDLFHGEIPHVKHLKLDLKELREAAGESKPPVTSSRTSARHSRPSHPPIAERKRKRRSADKVAEERQAEIIQNRMDRMSRRRQHRQQRTEQFYKSLHMLQTNARETGPFEDYSIYLYRQTAADFGDRVKDLEQKLLFPDREARAQDGFQRGGTDENFADRIKHIEQKFKNRAATDKKPPDLLRAIGKIESSDWNVKEIEKKMLENKMGKKNTAQEKERVPKWSREQFVARQSKIQKRALERVDSTNEKYKEIDNTVKKLAIKLKEGSALEQGVRGCNKVASMAEQFDTKQPCEAEVKPVTVQKSSSRSALALPAKGGSEQCHFCGSRVYLMERLSAEGKFFHRGCFRCQYCDTTLRLGFYVFDAQKTQKFYCPQHVGMQGRSKPPDKPLKRIIDKTIDDVTDTAVDNKVGSQTPERAEFSNLASGIAISESDDLLSQIDEDEWTDRNFGQSTAELDSSDMNDSDSDEAYEEALVAPVDGPPDVHSVPPAQDDSAASDDFESSSDDFSYYDYSSDDDDCHDSDTEDEDKIREARELRQQEVRLRPAPVVDTDTTASDTEVGSDEESESSEESQDSATEISTDSEFKLDGTTPTIEIPAIMLNEQYITKTRGTYIPPKRVQVRDIAIKKPNKTTPPVKPVVEDIELDITPIVPDIAVIAPKALSNTQKGFYFLNRTHSTEGIASKVSLELKKQYLLGNSGLNNNIQKSGSASTLDSKLKSFHSNISEHQKLLNPSPNITPTMQAFLDGTSKLHTPLSPTLLKDSKIDFIQHAVEISLQKSENENGIVSQIENAPESQVKCDSGNVSDSDLKGNSISTKTDDTATDVTVKQTDHILESDGSERARSPAHETSIVVPDVPWTRAVRKDYSDDIDTDSLTSSDTDAFSEKEYRELSHSSSTPNNVTVPRVEINNVPEDIKQENGIDENEEFAPGSLHIIENDRNEEEKKLIEHEKKDEIIELQSIEVKPKRTSSISEPKTLNQPKMLLDKSIDGCEVKLLNINRTRQTSLQRSSSDISVSSSGSVTGAALTETEMSDWARDGAVSDNLDDVEHDIDPDYGTVRRNKKIKQTKSAGPALAKLADFDDMGHICGRENTKELLGKQILSPDITDLDSIEFMDTASEENISDIASATNITLVKNQGYVQFVNVMHNIDKPSDISAWTSDKETSYWVDEPKVDHVSLDSSNKNNISILSNNGINDVKEPVNAINNTKENNVSLADIIQVDCDKNSIQTASLDSDVVQSSEPSTIAIESLDSNKKYTINENSQDYIEHVTRFQNKISEFSNARDSIDVRKSKSRSKNNSPEKSDSSSSKKLDLPSIAPRNLNLSFILDSSMSPGEKLKEISKERIKQKDLIHEMVMDKVRAQKKTGASRKLKNTPDQKRDFTDTINTHSPTNNVDNIRNFILQKSPTDSTLHYSSKISPNLVLTPTILDFSQSVNNKKACEELKASIDDNRSTSENKSIMSVNSQRISPDKLLQRHTVVFDTDTYDNEDPDKLFHRSSSINDKLMFLSKSSPSSEELSIPHFKSTGKKPNRAKSFCEVTKPGKIQKSMSGNILSGMFEKATRSSNNFKSEPCLVEKPKIKSNGGEKRKSIIQAVSDFFTKRRESSSSPQDSLKERFSIFRNSPKTKEKAKDSSSRQASPSISPVEEPPPVPPPPLEYSPDVSEDLAERRERRRSHHKRLRIAQEIQRRLEETEVRIRQLEAHGVELEKVLRGEVHSATGDDEEAVLAEWLALSRERAGLRRLERDLLARAQGLSLEETETLER